MTRSERSNGYSLQFIRPDRAGEHKGPIIFVLMCIEGTKLEFMPAYAPQSDDKFEGLF